MPENIVPILETEKLSAGYAREVIVGDVSLSVCQGEILCLIGPNGAGKTTILKTLTKQLDSCGGKISLIGKDFLKMGEQELARHLSMVMTEKIHPEYMTCREVVETGRYPYTGRLGILNPEDKKICDEALQIVGAFDIAERPFGKISDGQKQRIMFARAVAQQTEILILDEPTSFLDMRYKIDLVRIIRRLAKEQKKAVIISMHELELVRLIADKIVCINDGKLLKQGTVNEIFRGNFIQKLYGIKDEEFEPETAMMKINFPGVLGARPLGEGVASNEVLTRGKHSLPNRSIDEANRQSRRTVGFNASSIFDKGKASPSLIMIQGTMSNAGKSLLVAGLCRILRQDGWKVAPFKSQNMALNSYVTSDGLEMGRAQVMQAEAAGIEPSVLMNPILLKPTSDRKSQVIVNGEVAANMDARDYFEYKKQLVPAIMDAFGRLSAENDIIVIEGAGSPAEINLRENDIVNMGLAEMVDAPVLLVGDIDRGGVFAQLLGTLDLLSESERARVKGLVVNKFRGDVSLLEPGLRELEARGGVPVTGVVPYMKLRLDDEDSLTERFGKRGDSTAAAVTICVVRLPHISNFSDFSVFEQFEGRNGASGGVSLCYVDSASDLKKHSPDMIVLPGSKNTIGDLRWLKESGLADAVCEFAGCGGIVFGICGGYQMLGKSISDPDGVESEAKGGSEPKGIKTEGLGLLSVSTRLEKQKKRKQVSVKAEDVKGFFDFLNGKTIEGYEIHQGKSVACGVEGASSCDYASFPSGACRDNVYGSYIHGFFDSGDIALCTIKALAERKGITVDFGSCIDYKAFKESQYDLLADTLRKSLDMNAIYKILGISGKKEACDE